MTRLRLSRAAQNDLEDIQETGLIEFGINATRNHMAGFERIFALLRERPLTGQDRPDFGAGIRSFSHRPHRLLYRVERGEVLIVRILHGARDARSIMRDQQ